MQAHYENFSFDSQNVYFSGVYQLDEHRLQVSIRSNTNKGQSHAKIEVWSTLHQKWHEVFSIPPLAIKVSDKLCYRDTKSKEDFSKDIEILFNAAKQILSVKG